MIGRLIMLGLGAVSFVIVLMVALPADLFGRASDAPTALNATPAQVVVVDGDTMRLQQILIRLRGVGAPARGQACRTGEKTSGDCGTASSNALVALVRGHIVACLLNGHDRRGYALADCQAEGVSLNHAMVAGGWARAEPADAVMQDAETEARQAARGLWWGGGEVPL